MTPKNSLLTANPPSAGASLEQFTGIAPKILLIEDNLDDVALIERAFQQILPSVKLKILGNGEEAIAYLLGQGRYSDRQQHPMPDLIFLDLQIPRKSGLEVLAWIWEQPELKPIRVVVLTGSQNSTDIQRVRELDAYYQLKPSDFGNLAAFIEMICLRWLTPGPSTRRKTCIPDRARL